MVGQCFIFGENLHEEITGKLMIAITSIVAASCINAGGWPIEFPSLMFTITSILNAIILIAPLVVIFIVYINLMIGYYLLSILNFILALFTLWNLWKESKQDS